MPRVVGDDVHLIEFHLILISLSGTLKLYSSHPHSFLDVFGIVVSHRKVAVVLFV